MSDQPEKAPPSRGRKKGDKVGRTSALEIELRTYQLADKIGRGQKKYQLKKWTADEWGIAPRTFEDYYTRAYEFLLTTTNIKPEEEFLKSCAYYDSVMADETIEPRLRLKARIAKDKLVGIQRPRKLAMTDTAGEVVSPVSSQDVLGLTAAIHSLKDLSDDQLKRLAAANDVYQEISQGSSGTQNTVNQGKGLGTPNVEPAH